MRRTSAWLIGMAVATLPLPAMAGGLPPFLTPQHAIEPPRGFVSMCEAQPDMCVSPAATHLAVSDTAIDLLREVNYRVNRHVRQVSDQTRFARSDVWQPSGIDRGARGDCEDLALEKRKLLIEAGFPADRLFLALAYGQQGVGLHLVLVARTDREDVVLDSRSHTIQPWSAAPYTWIAMQRPEQPMAWFSV